MYKINEDLKNVDAFRFGYDPMPVWFLELFNSNFYFNDNKYLHHVRYTGDLMVIETIETDRSTGAKKTKDEIEIKRGQWVCKYIGTDNKIRVFENEDFKKQFVKYNKKYESTDIIFTGLSLIAKIIVISIIAAYIFSICMKVG